MAIVVESTTTNTASASSTITLTKPTGLAEGDLMFAVITLFDASDTISTLSGWTLLNAGIFQDAETNIQYKVADSSDVAASNFTFSASGSVTFLSGALMRISGYSGLDTIEDFAFNSGVGSGTGTTPVYSSSITPLADGALVVLAFSQYAGAGAQTFSGYTVTGGSVSFTELLDVNFDSGTNDPGHCVAYGLQTTATEITAYGATSSISKTNWIGTLVVINPRVDATGTNTLVTVDAESFSQTGTADATAENTLVATDSEVFTQNGTGTSPTQWTNVTKPSTSWTNQSKI